MTDPNIPKSGFSDVDRSPDPFALVQAMDRRAKSRVNRDFKNRVTKVLDVRRGHTVLDVGCGVGLDMAHIGSIVGRVGRVIGIDSSQVMLNEGRKRYAKSDLRLSFIRADGHHVPLPDNFCDRIRAEGVFQHLNKPAQALHDLVRVLKPGGRIVVADPDYELRVIDTPYKDVARRLYRFLADTYTQSDIAHRTYSLFVKQGLSDIEVEPMTATILDWEDFISQTNFEVELALAQKHGAITEEEGQKLYQDLEQAAQEGHFFAAMTFFIVSANKPR